MTPMPQREAKDKYKDICGKPSRVPRTCEYKEVLNSMIAQAIHYVKLMKQCITDARWDFIH